MRLTEVRLSALGLAASAALLLTSAQAFAATVVFDDFNDNQLAVDEPYPGSTNTSTIAFGAGTRTLTAENVSNNGNDIGATTLAAVGGSLSFSNDDLSTGTGTVTYTNVGDISSGANPFFFFEVGFFDNVANFIATAVDALGNTSTYQEVLQAGFDPQLFFSEFSGTADFNNLSTLSFMVDTSNVPGFGAVPSVDGSLRSISIGDDGVSPVPLPAGGLLLLAGLGGLAALRRKARA
ncbi:MAG: sorting protein [Cypionkella sp.]|uniref:VPLPA-CTERM sorting domain-containing protein n=1 Tax=Cypionkella sp. TaxID=2811411 RepID=UPI0026152D7B|nr:VPLPA-CTERM sorting domain-containing protein [Cypionkella sp.]MDB5661565.1 sorting protein [Cypionkella sp.]